MFYYFFNILCLELCALVPVCWKWWYCSQVEVGIVCFIYITSCAEGCRNMPPPPVTLTFDLESGVLSHVGYFCANFSLPRPVCSRPRSSVDLSEKNPLLIVGTRHFTVLMQFLSPNQQCESIESLKQFHWFNIFGLFWFLKWKCNLALIAFTKCVLLSVE